MSLTWYKWQEIWLSPKKKKRARRIYYLCKSRRGSGIQKPVYWGTEKILPKLSVHGLGKGPSRVAALFSRKASSLGGPQKLWAYHILTSHNLLLPYRTHHSATAKSPGPAWLTCPSLTPSLWQVTVVHSEQSWYVLWHPESLQTESGDWMISQRKTEVLLPEVWTIKTTWSSLFWLI